MDIGMVMIGIVSATMVGLMYVINSLDRETEQSQNRRPMIDD